MEKENTWKKQFSCRIFGNKEPEVLDVSPEREERRITATECVTSAARVPDPDPVHDLRLDHAPA
jgi:hypothetical protein